MTIQKKHTLLVAIPLVFLLILSASLIWQYRADYKDLKSMDSIIQLATNISAFSTHITTEKHQSWGATTLKGSYPPEVQLANFDNAMNNTNSSLKSLRQTLAGMDFNLYSEHIKNLQNKLNDYEDELKKLRKLVFDRESHPEDMEFYTDFIKLSYATFNEEINSLFSLLMSETENPNIANKIATLDCLIKMKIEFYMVRSDAGGSLRLKGIFKDRFLRLRTTMGKINAYQESMSFVATPEVLSAYEEFSKHEALTSFIHFGNMVLAEGQKDPGTANYAIEFGDPKHKTANKLLDSAFDDFLETIFEDLKTFTETEKSTAKAALYKTYSIAFFCVLITGLFGLFTSKSIAKAIDNISNELYDNANKTALFAGQVTNFSRELSENACSQAASIEEISASLEEMNSMTRQNLSTINTATEKSHEARVQADAGFSDVGEMRSAMEDINQASDEVSNIVKTIEEIAFQTNILALNAAVEAARAGEAGAGFAIVAEEVRNLAQRSANAANETAEKIDFAIQSSKNGDVISVRVESTLEKVAGQVHEFNSMLKEVEVASNSQTEGSNQVNESMTSLDSFAQTTAARAEETASSAEELDSQARALQLCAEHLNLLIGKKVDSKTQTQASMNPYENSNAYNSSNNDEHGGFLPHS